MNKVLQRYTLLGRELLIGSDTIISTSIKTWIISYQVNNQSYYSLWVTNSVLTGSLTWDVMLFSLEIFWVVGTNNSGNLAKSM